MDLHFFRRLLFFLLCAAALFVAISEAVQGSVASSFKCLAVAGWFLLFALLPKPRSAGRYASAGSGETRPISPEALLARYKEVLAAILPPQYLTNDGLLRLPSGTGDHVQIAWKPEYAAIDDCNDGYTAHVTDRPLAYRLRQCVNDLGAENVTAIQSFVSDRYHGKTTTRIVLHKGEESTFVHEVFHDIQAYLYDHHVEVHEALAKAVQDKKAEITALYDEIQRMPRRGAVFMFMAQHRWMFSYQPSQLFPLTQGDSPYANVYLPVVERFGWQTRFKIHTPIYRATLDLAHQEVIPTLLAGVMCGDTRVIPILQGIFQRGGLNEDFAQRLQKQSRAMLPGMDTSRRRPSPRPGNAAVEAPLTTAKVQNGAKYPSLPSPDVLPRQRLRDAWQCAECNAPGVHAVITNNLGLEFINHDWNQRPVAVDTVACPRHWETMAVFPLLLEDATIAALLDQALLLMRCGYFDDAEVRLRRALNARPASVEVRVRLTHLILDHMKLRRLLANDATKTYPRDRSICIQQIHELLDSIGGLEAPPDAMTNLAHARLALETGDLVTARARMAAAHEPGAVTDARPDWEAFEIDLQEAAMHLSPPPDEKENA